MRFPTGTQFQLTAFCTVFEMLSFKDIGVTTLTFLGSRDVIAHVTDHWTRTVTFSIGGLFEPTVSRVVVEILNFKDIESRP